MGRTDIGSRSTLDVYEELAIYMNSVQCYHKGGECDYTHVYPEVVDIICDRYQVSPDKVVLLGLAVDAIFNKIILVLYENVGYRVQQVVIGGRDVVSS